MKHQTTLIALLFQTVSLTLIAQKERVSGIYETRDDFINGKLSFDNNCKSTKIRLNDFFMQPYFTIKGDDNSLKLLKSDVFGYRNCNNEIFRFKGKRELLLLNHGASRKSKITLEQRLFLFLEYFDDAPLVFY